MVDKPDVRESCKEESAEIAALYPDAFPDEDLVPLVRDLLDEPEIALSLVAVIGSRIAGHVIYTTCGITGSDVKAALLGPLAVWPAHQRQGIGTALVRAGLKHRRLADVGLVCVLGDPNYYGRLGFRQESLVEPPFALPPEWLSAWQSQSLADTSTTCAGKLAVPKPWDQPDLWAP